MADSAPMVNACYRRQHPDMFADGRGDLYVPAPELPPGWGTETLEYAPSGPAIPEAPMGDPDARPINSGEDA